jgi:hypothetical protein
LGGAAVLRLPTTSDRAHKEQGPWLCLRSPERLIGRAGRFRCSGNRDGIAFTILFTRVLPVALDTVHVRFAASRAMTWEAPVSQQGVGTEQQAGQIPQQRPPTTAERGPEAADEVGGTTRQQAQAVAEETKAQTRQATDRLRERVGGETQLQVERMTQNLRGWADDLASMAEASPNSPVYGLVRDVAHGGRRAADHLDERGMNGILQDAQGFARRRPVAFLLGAVAAGFAVGRLVRTATKGQTRQLTADSPTHHDTGMGIESDQVHRAPEALP